MPGQHSFRTLGNRGLSLLELIIALAILAILGTAVLPMVEVTVKRSKEIELRRGLRAIRTAIDEYKTDFDQAVANKKILKSIDETGYPPDLETLLKGDDFGGLYGFKRKYLRRIPKDPFDLYGDGWELRAYADEPDATVYGGKDVFDVYSRSDGIALDGTPYNSW